MKEKINIDSMLVIDDTGMPVAPSIRQLVNKNIRELYNRDKSPNKDKYIKECIVIYYLGDPKSPAKQNGLSDAEALKMAIQQADLPIDYIPDSLVINLIKEYYDENITEAGKTLENIQQAIHNLNLVFNNINKSLNKKLTSDLSDDEMTIVFEMAKQTKAYIEGFPKTMEALTKAKEQLMYEQESEKARGGQTVSSSMDADEYVNQ